MPLESPHPAVVALLNVEAILKELNDLDFSSYENPDLVVKALARFALSEVRDSLESAESSPPPRENVAFAT